MSVEDGFKFSNKYRRSDWSQYHSKMQLSKKELAERNQQWESFYPTSVTPPGASFEEIVRQIALEASDILIKKHQDYGPDNINNAPGGAINGLLVRMHDKMERLKTLILGNKTPKYESIEDTLIDMINYSIISIMVQRGRWPSK